MGASRKIVHVDVRKRVALGSFARAETYLMDIQPNGTITLTPGEFTPIAAELPARKAALSETRRRARKKATPAAEPPQEKE